MVLVGIWSQVVQWLDPFWIFILLPLPEGMACKELAHANTLQHDLRQWLWRHSDCYDLQKVQMMLKGRVLKECWLINLPSIFTCSTETNIAWASLWLDRTLRGDGLQRTSTPKHTHCNMIFDNGFEGTQTVMTCKKCKWCWREGFSRDVGLSISPPSSLVAQKLT
jgi:hypothetical protein